MSDYKLLMNKFNDVAKSSIEGNKLYDELYPKALAEFIKDCTPPLTIAIQGEWGSGKTSMMNMIKAELKDPNIKFIEFNPWLFSQFNLGDKLPIILLTHLSEELSIKNKRKHILMKMGFSTLHFIGKYFGGTDNFLNNLTPDDIKKLNSIKNEFEKTVKKYLGVQEKSESQKQNKKLLIFMDDIDRLDPEKAVELLESIKLFCECKYCVFVLAVDYDIVKQGAEKKFGNNKGRVFFDKIIQVPFKMPIATRKFNNFMEDLLEEVLVDVNDEKNKNEWINLYIDISNLTIGSNPRSIKRMLNAFVISNNIADMQNIYNNLNSESINYIRLLLYSLLCIEYIDSESYSKIIKSLKVTLNTPDQNLFGEIEKCINELEISISKFDDIKSFLIKIFNALSFHKENLDNISKILSLSTSTTISNSNEDEIEFDNIPSSLKELNSTIIIPKIKDIIAKSEGQLIKESDAKVSEDSFRTKVLDSILPKHKDLYGFWDDKDKNDWPYVCSIYARPDQNWIKMLTTIKLRGRDVEKTDKIFKILGIKLKGDKMCGIKTYKFDLNKTTTKEDIENWLENTTKELIEYHKWIVNQYNNK